MSAADNNTGSASSEFSSSFREATISFLISSNGSSAPSAGFWPSTKLDTEASTFFSNSDCAETSLSDGPWGRDGFPGSVAVLAAGAFALPITSMSSQYVSARARRC